MPHTVWISDSENCVTPKCSRVSTTYVWLKLNTLQCEAVVKIVVKMKLFLLGPPPLLNVADQLGDGVPVVGPVVPQPQAPQHRQEVVNLECCH